MHPIWPQHEGAHHAITGVACAGSKVERGFKRIETQEACLQLLSFVVVVFVVVVVGGGGGVVVLVLVFVLVLTCVCGCGSIAKSLLHLRVVFDFAFAVAVVQESPTNGPL